MKKILRVHLALPLLAVLALAACGDDLTFPPEFDSSLGVDLSAMTRTASGLYYQDLVVGTGALLAQGDSGQVEYAGWLSDGRQFDAGTFWVQFRVQPRLIPGFEEGLETMQAGGNRKLVIPSELGYGPGGQGPIPGHATLIFDVELLEVRPAGG